MLTALREKPSLQNLKILLCVEFKASMAAEGLYLKIPISTSHTVFTKK